MKKSTALVKTLFGAAVLSLFLGFSSCKDQPKEEDTKEVAEDQNDAKFDNDDTRDDDSEFLVAAAEMDMMEIEMGKLAQTRSTHSGVKAYAAEMVAAHTKASEELKPFADRLQVSLPAGITEDGKQHFEKLNGQSGKDFDEHYIGMMVDGHEDAVSKMEKASNNAKDPEIKAWATNMLPTLRSHLDKAKMLKEQLKTK